MLSKVNRSQLIYQMRMTKVCIAASLVEDDPRFTGDSNKSSVDSDQGMM